MDRNFEFITNLQYEVKRLSAQVAGFRSGEKFAEMNERLRLMTAEKDAVIKRLNYELSVANSALVTMRENWFQATGDLEKGHKKELAKKDHEIKALKERALNAERRLDEEKDKFRDKVRELYQVKTELEEEKGKNQKLKAQISRDYENSSKPSSLKPNHKKITNNREKTGKKPGGQPGHKGHLRKKHTPTNMIAIPAPEKYTASPDYRPTGKIITKQMVDIRVEVTVDEYSTPEFRNVRTGQRVHAEFPEGVINDVNYSGNIKAFAFLLNNRCNVSIANVSDFLSDLTGGGLKVSTGMINGLGREFSLKTEADQKQAFADILLAPVINTDFTSGRVNGQNMNVALCAIPANAIYLSREHKGHEGIRGTPVEDYRGILVHDHDKTFYNYGDGHQECLDHVLRYLKDSMLNEPNLRWNQKMRGLIREMIHFRNSLDPDDDRDPDVIDPDKVAAFEAQYDEILKLAKDEYEYEPPGKYYRDGFNLYKRLFKYKGSHFLFLYDRRVPHNNNLAERLLRIYKRKQQQVMTFRSFDSMACLCQSLGTIASVRAQGKNLYESVASIFDRPTNKSGNTIS